MPVIVEQKPDMEAGHARLTVPGAGGLDPASVEIAISAQADGVEKHLDPAREGPAAWAAGENWFRPDAASMSGEAMSLELGPSATWHLKPYQPYMVGLRDAAGGHTEDRMSWVALRLPSDPPPPAPERPAAVEPEPAPAAESEAEKDPFAAFAELEANAEDAIAEPLRTDEEGDRQDRRTGRYILIGVLALLLVVAAAALWFFKDDLLGEDAQTPGEEITATDDGAADAAAPDQVQRIPLTLEAARSYLIEDKPAAAAAQEEAQRFADAGQVQAAFILRKYAAQAGSADAALEMGRTYDPASHEPGGVIEAPDAEAAAGWYERAAEAGNVDAMVRLGEMLKTGAVERPDAPERSVFWLRKAAEAGNEKAEELLQ